MINPGSILLNWESLLPKKKHQKSIWNRTCLGCKSFFRQFRYAIWKENFLFENLQIIKIGEYSQISESDIGRLSKWCVYLQYEQKNGSQSNPWMQRIQVRNRWRCQNVRIVNGPWCENHQYHYRTKYWSMRNFQRTLSAIAQSTINEYG